MSDSSANLPPPSPSSTTDGLSGRDDVIVAMTASRSAAEEGDSFSKKLAEESPSSSPSSSSGGRREDSHAASHASDSISDRTPLSAIPTAVVPGAPAAEFEDGRAGPLGPPPDDGCGGFESPPAPAPPPTIVSGLRFIDAIARRRTSVRNIASSPIRRISRRT